MLFLYNIAIAVYGSLISIAAFFNHKARQWKHGRRNLFSHLESKIDTKRSWIWMHCASLGEFEQGRPVLELLREKYPEKAILLTFFSPSGYEIRKHYELVDYVTYLPLDTPRNTKHFLKLVQPEIAIFVKYEFWYHYLHQLKKTNTPTLLISAIFHSKQPFFHPIAGRFFRKILACFSLIQVQNINSAKRLQAIGIQHVEVAGDTRIDRVMKIPTVAKSFPKIALFRGTANLLVAGSTWQPDEAILVDFIQQHQPPNWKFLFAPHDISSSHIEQLEESLNIASIRYSQINDNTDLAAIPVLILDTIGMLSQVYQYGKLAYIGGGFGRGIHNTLEPAAFGLPILIGTNYQKFEEANQLVKSNACFAIANLAQFTSTFIELQNEKVYRAAQTAIGDYLYNNQGASTKALQAIEGLLRK